MSQTKKQFKEQVVQSVQQISKLLAIYQSGQRDFEYEVSEEARLKTALFSLEELLQ